jgi:hypothetical protein
MKHSEVLSRYVNTGIGIPEEQFDRLSKSLQKSYLRIRGVVGDYSHWELKYINDNQRINYIREKGKWLDNNYIEDLIKYSDNKDDIAIRIIDGMGESILSILSNLIINSLTNHSENKDDIITKIIQSKSGSLYSYDIPLLLKYSINKDDIATKIIQAIGEKLDYVSIEYILKDFENVNDHIAIKIIETLGEKLISNDIECLLNFSDNVNDNVTIKIIETKGEKLDRTDLSWLLRESKDIDKTAIKIIETKGEKLDGGEIFTLLKRSKNKELMKKTLLQNDVDYKLINDVINGYNKNFNLNIPLIPDNYQSMLQEIRRIKEIMI